MFEKITADRAAIAPRPPCEPLIVPDAALAVHIYAKTLEGIISMIYEVLDHNLNDEGQLELLVNLGPS